MAKNAQEHSVYEILFRLVEKRIEDEPEIINSVTRNVLSAGAGLSHVLTGGIHDLEGMLASVSENKRGQAKAVVRKHSQLLEQAWIALMSTGTLIAKLQSRINSLEGELLALSHQKPEKK